MHSSNSLLLKEFLLKFFIIYRCWNLPRLKRYRLHQQILWFHSHLTIHRILKNFTLNNVNMELVSLPSTDGENNTRCSKRNSPYFINAKVGSSAVLNVSTCPRSKRRAHIIGVFFDSSSRFNYTFLRSGWGRFI